MDIIIVTRFHHGGKFVEDTSGGGLTYIGESEVEYVDPTTNNFVLVDNDFSLLNLIKDLGDGDFLDLYVQHVIDEVEIIKDGVPTATQSENINVEVGVDDASDLEGVETDWDISDDSQEFAIPDDDDSEIDEELRTLRNERRTKLQRKKPDSTEEIILGVAGVDRGFEDIGRNKAARYVGRLGGDEQYIDSSELDSDDSRDELDPEAVEGYSQPPSSSVGSIQPPSSRQPRSCSQPPSSVQPVGSSQPPTWRTSQHVSSGQQSTSICDDTSIVRRVQQAGKGRGRGRGKGRGRGGDDTSTVTRGQQAGRGKGREGASTSTRGNKRPKTVGFGIYTDDLSGRQTLNPGTTGERVVTPAVFKCATPTNIDIGYKPRGLKWKGKDAVTTPQLQRMSKSKGGGSANV
ncbi:hypothetical protein KY284_015199 [Solanum tuberosum]|nr:hypothetical protein KY284_015199 [Solanum tuberosum]